MLRTHAIGQGCRPSRASLLTWPGSAIVHDIKGENWQLTAGLRSRFGRVLLFDPTDAASAAYNPLLEVRRGEWEVRDVENVADVLVDPEGSLERRNHWEKTSHSLLVGAILHVLYAEKDKTLAGVASFLSDPRRPIETTLGNSLAEARSRVTSRRAVSEEASAPQTAAPARSPPITCRRRSSASLLNELGITISRMALPDLRPLLCLPA